MEKEQFKLWRKTMGLTQTGAARVLGLNRNTIELYERGTRRDDPNHVVSIPRTVELACAALLLGIHRYSGPDEMIQDDLKVDVAHLVTPDGLRSGVEEWIDKHVTGSFRIINNVAAFSRVSEAVLFKLTWDKANFEEQD
ncbi:helix-turn-helix domain-containing protein [Microvirga sp. P5_D2]